MADPTPHPIGHHEAPAAVPVAPSFPSHGVAPPPGAPHVDGVPSPVSPDPPSTGAAARGPTPTAENVEEVRDGADGEEPDVGETSQVLGAKAMVVRKVVPGHHEHDATEVGGAVFYEGALAEWFAIEGAFGALQSLGHGQVLSVDVVAKVLWNAHEHFEPYVGVGGAVVFELPAERHPTEVLAGGVATVGAFVWLDARFGVDVEATYTVMPHGEDRIHEVTGATGAVARF